MIRKMREEDVIKFICQNLTDFDMGFILEEDTSGYFVQLKKNYLIRLQIKFFDHSFGIHMRSNQLCEERERDKIRLIKKISEENWLPIKDKTRLNAYGSQENFSNFFLKLALAIREFDINKKTKIKNKQEMKL